MTEDKIEKESRLLKDMDREGVPQVHIV